MVSSCNRKPVHKIQPDFIGSWRHIENLNEFWYISIDNDSYGQITLYDSLSNIIDEYGENPHKWRVNSKTNYLTQGLYNASFHIDKYPTKITENFAYNYDTMKVGESLMILEGKYYVKRY